MKKNRILAVLLCFMLSCALFFVGRAVAAQADESGLQDALPDAALDEIFRRYDTMGASVVVFRDGQIIYSYQFGLAHLGGPSVTQDTGFQVGSIGKLVACVGLMQLVEKGACSLEDDLSDLFGFPVRNPYHPDTPVTLRQLLTHTAGLRDGPFYDQSLKGAALPLSEVFASARENKAFYKDYPPGERLRYSNFGGGLVGSLIELLSGQLLDEYLTDHVFTPLGITAAYQASRLPPGMPLADMYQMPSKRLTKTLRDDTTALQSADPLTHYGLTAGKLIITAPDLAKLLMMLCDGGQYEGGRLLKEQTALEMKTPQNTRGSVLCDSGRGLMMNIIADDQVEGRTLYGHGGKANGMLCAAYFDPTDHTGVVMLTNGCNNRKSYRDVGMLGRQILTECYRWLDFTKESMDTETLYTKEDWP